MRCAANQMMTAHLAGIKTHPSSETFPVAGTIIFRMGEFACVCSVFTVYMANLSQQGDVSTTEYRRSSNLDGRTVVLEPD